MIGRHTEETDDREAKGGQPSAVKVVALFWGIPIVLFTLIYVLRHCLAVW